MDAEIKIEITFCGKRVIIGLFENVCSNVVRVLFSEELESFENDHLIKLIVCFSQFPRSEENIRYVQHNIVKFGESLLKLLLNDERTKIFVCGDAKNMANDVFNSFVDILITEGGKSKEEALQFLKLMQDHHRYVQDVWT